tara:strand:+ start:23 stop:361 length:339 start_codon:yes stop_codon:yes gene_type:complete
MAFPIPSSGLYDWCKQTGLLKDDQSFYDRYICQDWSLDQIPVNMTKMSDQNVQEIFKKANENLSQFYIERMSIDWIKHFSEDAASAESASVNPATLKHLHTRVETGMNQTGL